MSKSALEKPWPADKVERRKVAVESCDEKG